MRLRQDSSSFDTTFTPQQQLTVRIIVVERHRGRSQRPRAERAVGVRGRKVFALVVPGYRAQGLRRLPPHLGHLAAHIPETHDTRFVGD